MVQYAIDFESVIVDVKDETYARIVAKRMIKEGDIKIDVIVKLGD